MNLEDVKKFLETDKEGIRWINSYIEKKNKEYIDCWKSKNFQKEIDKRIKELYPEEDPKDKEIKELKLEFERIKKQNAKKEVLSKIGKIANEKKLPMQIVELLVSDDLEVTNNNMKVLEDTWSAALKNSISSKIEPYIPTYGNNDSLISKQNFINMSYQDKKKLKQENPDLYDSLTNN